MSTKHTPGNWSYGESIDGMWFVESDHCLGEMICETMSLSPGEAEANARLMSAAPELLEALESFVVGIECSIPAVTSAFADRLAQARAAIAKAKEES